MIESSKIKVDLSPMLKYTNQLIPDSDIELKLIELYKFKINEDNDPIDIFTTLLLSVIYKDDKLHAYEEITFFYKEKEYLLIVSKFISYIEHIILNSLEPDFIDVSFSRFIKKDKLLTEFIVTRFKE